MSEGRKVSVLVLGQESLRALQGGNEPNWSLVFVPQVKQNPFKLTGLQQRCVTEELGVVWPIPGRVCTLRALSFLVFAFNFYVEEQ